MYKRRIFFRPHLFYRLSHWLHPSMLFFESDRFLITFTIRKLTTSVTKNYIILKKKYNNKYIYDSPKSFPRGFRHFDPTYTTTGLNDFQRRFRGRRDTVNRSIINGIDSCLKQFFSIIFHPYPRHEKSRRIWRKLFVRSELPTFTTKRIPSLNEQYLTSTPNTGLRTN